MIFDGQPKRELSFIRVIQKHKGRPRLESFGEKQRRSTKRNGFVQEEDMLSKTSS